MSTLIPKGLGMLEPRNTSTGLGMLDPSKREGAGTFLGNALLDFVPPPPPPAHNALAVPGGGALSPRSSLGNVFLEPETKRKAYFAFRFEDIMRVNNVRKAWCIDHPDTPAMRTIGVFGEKAKHSSLNR